jgi:guanyl-specific ribonuclease Sa
MHHHDLRWRIRGSALTRVVAWVVVLAMLVIFLLLAQRGVSPGTTPAAGAQHLAVTPDGTIDLSASVARINAGIHYPHRNDGAVFQNREGRLPERPEGYYHEYVQPTPGQGGPGAQRIIKGSQGEWYYSPDHYETFIRFE